MRQSLPAALLLSGLAVVSSAAPPLEIDAGTGPVPVVVSTPLPPGTDATVNVVELPGGQHAPAQVSGKTVTFVLPGSKGKVTVRPATLTYVKAPPQFAYKDEPGQHTDLLFGDRPVMRFVNAPHDPKDHFYTFKPFHQVFDPATGKVNLTSGSYKTSKEGKFPHHRGLFFGFNRISYDGKTADIWHGSNNVFSQVVKSLGREAGEVFARERSFITWHGTDGKPFASEERAVTAYNAPGGTLIDWSTTMTTELPKVRLDGDPQHAGFHFRANQDVAAKTAKETYYLRPDGKGKPGETRNWDAKGKAANTVNLPWNAMSFVLDGARYTVVRVNHPDNPKETRGSERDYGRFGDYFEYDLTPSNPLKLKYRVWVQEGEMTGEQCQALAAGFATSPAATVGK